MSKGRGNAAIPVGIASGPSKRNEIIQVITALIALASATLAGLGIFTTNQQAKAQHGTDVRGQEADRFSKAIEYTGSDSPDVRRGGIYALGGLLRDGSRDTDAIIEVLSTYVRMHAKVMEGSADRPTERQATNVQAAIDVLIQRPEPEKHRDADLSGARLSGANFRGATLVRLDLTGADLSFADFRGTDASAVTGLTSRQIRCTLTDAGTALPVNVIAPQSRISVRRSACA